MAHESKRSTALSADPVRRLISPQEQQDRFVKALTVNAIRLTDTQKKSRGRKK